MHVACGFALDRPGFAWEEPPLQERRYKIASTVFISEVWEGFRYHLRFVE